MRGWEAVLGVILVSVWGAAGYGALSVTEDAGKVTVQSEHYGVTFDKAQGGRITQMGSRAVTQSDSADGYAFGGDGKAEVTVSREDADRVEVKVRAHYAKNGQKPPSEMDAEYRYLFDGRSRLARCKATITQREVQFFADVYGYPHWQKVSILDLGSEAGWRGSFGGRSKSVTVHFTPGAAKALDVSPEEAKSFDALVAPRIARQARLMDERFEAKSRWYDVCGAWTLETGALLSRSPQGSAAWTVAGETDWKDYIVETDVRTRDGSSHVFLCGRWQDMGNHYELQHLEHPVFAMRIVRVRGGERVTLAEAVGVADLRTLPGTKLALEVNANRLRAYREGEMVLEAYDSAFRAGRVALGVASQDSVWFQRVDVFAVEPAKGDVPSAMLREPVQRHAFYRDEKAAQIAFIVVAQSPGDGLAANFALESVRYPTRGESERKVIPLGALKAGEEREVRFGLQPHLWRSGDYLLTATVTQGALTLARERARVSIRRRPNPERMVINLWQAGEVDAQRAAQWGFNQVHVWSKPTLSRWADGKYKTPDDPRFIFQPDRAAERQHIVDLFDECLRHGLWGYMRIEYVRRVPEGVTDAYALKRNGKELQDRPATFFGAGVVRPNPWHPKVAEVVCDYFRGLLAAFKDSPAWHSVLLNSESERDLDVYGNDYWLAMARKELGFEVPADVNDSWGARGRPLPTDGIVESNDPYYRFYRWWWERGEGQGVLHAKVAQAVKQVRPDLVTWHDPALRQPFVRGRLAGLDQIGHWCYAWPNLSRLPLIADELRLAATPGQQRLLMLQVITWGWAAIPPQGPHWPHVKHDGMYHQAHSPSTIREATWLALSRGVSAIAYYGLATADRTGLARDSGRAETEGIGYGSCVYSNPDTLLAIREMSERVIQPYGMVLKRLRPMKGEVALLLPTATAVLACRDAEDFIADEAGHIYAKLQAAHAPVDALYEIDLEEKGLAGYKAIALPGCRVLPRHIYDMIRKFADEGGVVLADQHLVPKFANVVRLPREARAWGGEAPLQDEQLRQATLVRDALDGRIRRWADCDSPSVVLHTLEDGATQWLFVINNLRRFGDYLGPWGKVLDDGVAQRTKVRVRKTDGVIYDALGQQKIEPTAEGQWLTWDVDLGPGEGRMFVVRPVAIAAVSVRVAEQLVKGTTSQIFVRVHDSNGRPAAGLLPLRVAIRDSQGVESDYSDYSLARDGQATVELPIALNEPSGAWRVRVRELVSGQEGSSFFQVRATK